MRLTTAARAARIRSRASLRGPALISAVFAELPSILSMVPDVLAAVTTVLSTIPDVLTLVANVLTAIPEVLVAVRLHVGAQAIPLRLELADRLLEALDAAVERSHDLGLPAVVLVIPPVSNILAMIASIFTTVVNVLSAIAHILAVVANVLSTVTSIFAPIADILSMITCLPTRRPFLRW